MPDLTRRTLLMGAAGATGAAALASCSAEGTAVPPASPAVRAAERARRVAGRGVVHTRLTAQPMTVNLGGKVVHTWGYGDGVPGPVLRATAGDLLRVDVDNRLPDDTSVHFHGVALRNDMDGVPGVTQDPIGSGGRFRYEFTVPDPGTYFYHPHVGVQLDRGLYGALVVDDPAEPGAYDEEWVVVLDDWVDGTGRTPDDVLAGLVADGGGDGSSGGDGGMGGMGGMDHGSMGGMGGMGGAGEGMQSRLLGGAGDVDYPYYLVNGRTAGAPTTLVAKPGQRVRIRIVNAATDTAFRVAVGGHTMTVTHSDGYPVLAVEADAVLVGMGERFDVVVTLGDGAFPLVASAEGKAGQGMAVVRTGSGSTPAPTVSPRELDGRVVLGAGLEPRDDVRLRDRGADAVHDLVLTGSMAPYRWTINGKTYEDADPVDVTQGERVRLRFQNMSMMFHPMHLHGHSFAVRGGGARKDTVVVRPMERVEVDLDAVNPGQWMLHCHNLYHAERGMMTTLSYRS